MDWTLEQIQRINELQNWYLEKTNAVIDAIEKGKINICSYWEDCRKLVAKCRSCKQLREWQIVFENVENIIHNVYVEY